MGMSDCEKCWETPCMCGHDYRNWSESRKAELVKALTGATDDESLRFVRVNNVRPGETFSNITGGFIVTVKTVRLGAVTFISNDGAQECRDIRHFLEHYSHTSNG